MWQPIETAPKDQFLLLCGPSGYTTIPFIFTTGRTCSDYHLGRWIGHANDDLTAWGFEPTHWATLPDPLGAQPSPSFADAYQGAMEDVAIWKKRALEAEDLNRKFIAEINGPAYMGEPAQPAPSVPVDLITDYLVSISAHVAHQDDPKAQAEIGELLRMLAAAPEAKP